MLNKDGLKEALKTAIQSGPFPGSKTALSSAIVSYVMANGTALSPTISYTLAPASGDGWEALIAKASSSGVGNDIISTAIATEFASSTKEIPAPHGTQIVPMSFNSGASVKNLTDAQDFDEVWGKISEAIIDFFSTEIK